MNQQNLRRAIYSFPLFGLLQGLLYFSLFYGLIVWTPLSNVAIAFFLSLVMVIFTGGLHLDGLIDTSDAYFSYRDTARRLEIMSDPTVGAFGVISVIIHLSARFLFIYEIIMFSQIELYFLIILVPLLSKTIMGYLLMTTKTAKDSGLAHFFQQTGKSVNINLYLIFSSLLVICFSIYNFHLLIYSAILTIFAIVFSFYSKRFIVKNFGGITGDTLGAAVEGSELVLWLTIWLLQYCVMV